jgi:hypothetical protein
LRAAGRAAQKRYETPKSMSSDDAGHEVIDPA